MKFLLLALVISLPVLAEEKDQKGEMFAEAKAQMLSNLDQRISHLTSTKACVSAAADGAALKKCREEMKTEMKGMHEEMKSKREAFKAKRKAMKGN
ncbi:MAG: hypothetical protein K2P81_07695 [Bacteriovoracaceae bacterium]|nr:hypothetical protein [Bacteriovoracaceae bacterium]